MTDGPTVGPTDKPIMDRWTYGQYAVWKNAELLWDQNVHVQIRRSTAKTRYKQFEVPTSSVALRSVVIYDFKTWYSSFVVLFCHVLNALKQIWR